MPTKDGGNTNEEQQRMNEERDRKVREQAAKDLRNKSNQHLRSIKKRFG